MQGAQVDPEQMQKMQEELQKLQMENATLKLENKIKEDKHEVDIYNAETQRIRALSDHEVDANQMERSEEHTSELQSLMRISYAVFCLKKKNNMNKKTKTT